MLSQIKTCLPGHPWRERIIYLEEIDSTNTYAKALAMQGAPEGTVVIAGSQTGGRGRLGRSFSSPAGMGIYMSIILRPDCAPTQLMHLTCAAGVAASLAVETATGMQPGIKWTNDLVLGKRKLGGILTELSVDPGTGKVVWAVVGIGINCCQAADDFPPEIREIACSLALEKTAVPQLTAALVASLHGMRADLFDRKAETMDAFRRRCVNVGQDISILRGDAVQRGTAVGIDGDGALLVRFPDGHTEAVASGEVSIRGMYGYI